MKNFDRKKAVRVLAAALAASALFSLYLAAVFQSSLKGSPSFSPFAVFSRMGEYGFPKVPFLVIFAVTACLCFAAYWQFCVKKAGWDPLGRRFRVGTERQPYGDAHPEEPEEYENAALIQTPEKAYGTIFGQLDDSGRKLINFRMDAKNRLNGHIAVVGASGSGKTFTFTKPYCFQAVKRRESVIITDPDGNLHKDMAGYFQDNGYTVRRLNLVNLYKSDGWDCLKTVYTGSDAELNAQMFAQIVLSNLVEDMSSIYGQGPMSLLRALILYVVMSDTYPPEKKNIRSVYEMLQNPHGEAYLDSVFIDNPLREKEKAALGPYLAFKQGSPNLRGNLITNLSIQLQLLQNDMVCKVLSTDDIDMTLPGKQPCAYFCQFPDYHDTYRFVVSLFFSMLFVNLIDFADSQDDGKLPVPVNFLLDEFPSIGIIPDWDRKISTIRKRGINAVMIFQDITQLQNNYEKSWVTILSNCSTLLFLGVNDEFTSRMVSERIGDTTVKVSTEHRSSDMETIFRAFNSRTSGEGRRSLLSFDEVFKIGEDDSILIFQTHNPIICKKYPYILHPEAKKLRKIYDRDIPDITNAAARAEVRRKENAYIAEWLIKHPLEEVDRSYEGVCEPEIKKGPADRLKSAAAAAGKRLGRGGPPRDAVLGSGLYPERSGGKTGEEAFSAPPGFVIETMDPETLAELNRAKTGDGGKEPETPVPEENPRRENPRPQPGAAVKTAKTPSSRNGLSGYRKSPITSTAPSVKPPGKRV